MKVAIFETQHPEVAYPVTRLFDNGTNHITIFSYEEAYGPLKHLLAEQYNRYDWIIKKERQSKVSFIYTLYQQTKKRKIQVLYLDTVTDNFIFYAIMIFFSKKVRVILTIHSINNFFDHKFSFSLRRIIRTIGKKMLLRVTKEFNVISAPSVKYLKSKLPERKKVHCIPNAIFEKTSYRQSQSPVSEKINIVIPGTVEKRRRNYDQAFELIAKLKNENIPFSITFLGKLSGNYGQEVLAKCKDWNSQNNNINYYEGTGVDQAEFDRVMNEATVIFMPLVIHTIVDDDIIEICGVSSTSGNITEVIRHAKPFIIPGELAIDPCLEKSCFRYSSTENIVSFISRIYQDPAYYHTLLEAAWEASEHFTIENIRNRIAAVIE